MHSLSVVWNIQSMFKLILECPCTYWDYHLFVISWEVEEKDEEYDKTVLLSKSMCNTLIHECSMVLALILFINKLLRSMKSRNSRRVSDAWWLWNKTKDSKNINRKKCTVYLYHDLKIHRK